MNGLSICTDTILGRRAEDEVSLAKMPNMLRDMMLGGALTLATLALLILIGRGEATRMARTATAQQARAIETGAALYDTHCRSCHGGNGEGVADLGPALNDRQFFTTRRQEVGWSGSLKDYIVATVSMGRVTATEPRYPGVSGAMAMAAWSQAYGGPLRSAEIEDVAAFVMNWQRSALAAPVVSPLPTPTFDGPKPAAPTSAQP